MADDTRQEDQQMPTMPTAEEAWQDYQKGNYSDAGVVADFLLASASAGGDHQADPATSGHPEDPSGNTANSR